MAFKHKNRPSGPELREILIDEAFTVVERIGVESLSATAVSLAVGASNAASYSHFRDGATELLAAVAVRGFDHLTAVLGEPPSTALVEARVSQLFLLYVRFGLEHPHLYRAMFSPRLAIKLGNVNVGTGGTSRGARTYEELTVAKATTYAAFVSAVHGLGQGSGASLSHQGDSAKAVASLAHGLVLEFIDEGIDLGTTSEQSRMTKRLGSATRLIEMLLHGILGHRA